MTDNIKAALARSESWLKIGAAIAAALFAAGKYAGQFTERISQMEERVGRIEAKLETMPTKQDLATIFPRGAGRASRASGDGR